MRWTEELHQQFVEAVECLGGQDSESSSNTFLLLLHSNCICRLCSSMLETCPRASLHALTDLDP